ncbi:MAG: SDR family oxidoreductase [Dehalococcoidia bacterium]|nr:SDR family oxidoreductase [Dehalococcoidia bacterium]
MKLKGQVAIITGAATGIGRASAKLFAREGAQVAIADINDRDGLETAKMIQGEGGQAVFIHTDVSSVPQLEQMVRIAVEKFGKLTIFFHNAGVAGPGPLETTTEESYDRCMAVNLKAGFFGAKYAAPEIRRAGGGCILFTSSGLGLRPSPQSPAYSISKAGLIMLTRSLAVSLAKHNIRVNAICPGPINETPIWQDFVNRVPGADVVEYERMALDGRPIARFGTVQEMARAALFLVSPENSYITGVALPVDGGGVAR